MFFTRSILQVVMVCSLAMGCVSRTGELQRATGVAREQPAQPGRETFGISEEDIRYIELIVPDYAEIVLYHEAAPETVVFSKQLVAWFYAHHASIELHPVKKITGRQPPANRNFSIDFIGDHRYVVRLFDKTEE